MSSVGINMPAPSDKLRMALGFGMSPSRLKES